MRNLDEKGVAEVLLCSVAKLRKMRRDGTGPRWVRIGRLCRYPEEWLIQYIEANEVRQERNQCNATTTFMVDENSDH